MKRRLLFVTPFYKPSFVYGGPVRSISSLCEELVALGCEVDVLTTNANGEKVLDVGLDTPIDVNGVRVRYFPQSKIRGSFFYSPELRRRCAISVRDVNLAYIYGVWNYPATASAAECRRARLPYVVSPRTSLMEWPMRHGALRKRLYLGAFGKGYLGGAAAVHYTSDTEMAESRPLTRGAPGFVVPNPVDLSEFDKLPTRGRFRAAQGLPGDAPVLLYLGRIEPRKGLDFTLRAFAQARSAHTSARLVIAGPPRPAYLQELQELVGTLGLREAVTFVGYLDAARRLEALVDADVFVLTSHAENFGMAVVEAVAAGTPVLLSDRVGVAGDHAIRSAGMVTPLDVSPIATAMGTMLGAPAAWRERGEQGRRLVYEEYRADAIAKRVLTEFERVLDGGRSAGTMRVDP